jgi:nitroreductase
MDGSSTASNIAERVGLTVEDAIRGRQSIRAFLDTPVPNELIARIIETAARAPSGSNIQPWKVIVVTGEARDSLVKEVTSLHAAGGDHKREYNYYPVNWRDPYLARRRACGWGLYTKLGIARSEKERMHAQHGQNYTFFGAPVGLICTMDRDMEIGSWLDTGMFLQSLMVAARQFGLETCPQAAWANFHKVLQARLAIPETEMVVCAIALGYPDPNADVNTYRTEREPLDVFVRWVDKLPNPA